MIRLGLALGSGGARGLAHLGVLSVLERAGLRPACIAGTSMGAIVGAVYAELGNAAAATERLRAYTADPSFRASWEPFVIGDDLERQSLFREMRLSLQRKLLEFRGFLSPSMQHADHLRGPLQRALRTRTIEELGLPFAAVAIDLLSGEAVVFHRGDLVSAVYASSAIPGVVPPLRRGGQLLVDGGGVHHVPVAACRDLGADFVLAVDVPAFADERHEYKTALDVFLRSDQIAREQLGRLQLRDADMIVRPDIARFHWAHFAAAERIRTAGETAMEAALPELRRRLSRRRAVGHRLRRRVGGWLANACGVSLAPERKTEEET